ncbi:hypothetical protein Lser_V15G24590 [Lactuca serriola]
MDWEADEKEVKTAGAELPPDGRRGLRIHGWEIESSNRSVLTSLNLQSSKPFQQVILDYDYTFTTPYSGSETVESGSGADSEENKGCLKWEDCDEQINVVALASKKEPILFYDEVILYEDELRDTRVVCTFNENTKPLIICEICWRETTFKALASLTLDVDPSSTYKDRFSLRVDGALMRLRDTRVFCTFNENSKPLIIREICWRETTFKALASVWEEKLETTHLQEMMFGDSCLVLKHMSSGTKIHFNAFDALLGWKKEALPPVEVPAAAHWKFRSLYLYTLIFSLLLNL